MVLTPQMEIQALQTGMFEPIPKGSMGLMLGKSSSMLKGIKILPKIIDYTHTEKITVMIEATMGVLVIP